MYKNKNKGRVCEDMRERGTELKRSVRELHRIYMWNARNKAVFISILVIPDVRTSFIHFLLAFLMEPNQILLKVGARENMH